MLKLYKIKFMDGTWTAVLAEDNNNALMAVEVLFPNQQMCINGTSERMTHWPMDDCRPPVAEEVLTQFQK